MTLPQLKYDVLPVVDHEVPGFVRLVSYMQPAERGVSIQESHKSGDMEYAQVNREWTGDLEVVRNARVSFNADWRTGNDDKGDAKLLRYLMANRHTSPFEAMTFTFEVKAPLLTFRQWHRHRTWAYSELSARYATLDEGFYVPTPDKLTTQSKDNKQARTEEKHPRAEAHIAAMIATNRICQQHYRDMLTDGVPRELARSVLPVASYSRMFATVNLHNLLGYITLREHKHAQYEIRVYPEAMLKLIALVCPVIVGHYKELRGG